MPEFKCSVSEVEDIFLAAMRVGYAADSRNIQSIPRLPDAHLVEFIENDFRAVDVWFAMPGSKQSSGLTTVYCHGVPVWRMSYEGWHDPTVVTFLRSVLRKAYDANIFIGGRGLTKSSSDDTMLCYQNDCVGRFVDFSGWEIIKSQSGKARPELMGKYSYRGGLLVDYTNNSLVISKGVK